MTISCGIDFGTTNSSAAVADTLNSPYLICLEKNKDTIPTALFLFDNGKVSIGREASCNYINGERGRYMRSLKRVLGTDLMSSGTAVNGRLMSFTNILSYFLKYVKKQIDENTKEDVVNVVLGRPVHFRDDDPIGDEKAEQELKEIAKLSGFKNIAFQYEPIAAAFAHEKNVKGEKLACVIDIGGGTSDFTIIKIGQNLINKTDRNDDILASTGVRIGGNDFDKDLAIQCFMPELGMGGLQEKTGTTNQHLPLPTSIYYDLAEWSKVNQLYAPKEINFAKKMLYQALDKEKVARLLELLETEQGHTLLSLIEQNKIDLTTDLTAQTTLTFLSGAPKVISTRKQFEDSLSHDLHNIKSTIDECLKQAQVNFQDIELIILTGGSTEIPCVENLAKSCFPQAQLSKENKLSSVGLGLAYDSLRRF